MLQHVCRVSYGGVRAASPAGGLARMRLTALSDSLPLKFRLVSCSGCLDVGRRREFYRIMILSRSRNRYRDRIVQHSDLDSDFDFDQERTGKLMLFYPVKCLRISLPIGDADLWSACSLACPPKL